MSYPVLPAHSVPRPRLWSRRSFAVGRGPQRILLGGLATTVVAVVLGTLVPDPNGVLTMAVVPTVGAGAAAFALTVAALGVRGIDRAIRSWVAVAAWAWFLGHALRLATGTADQVDGGLLANALWIGGYFAAAGFGVTVARRLDRRRGLSLALDAVAVTGAIILAAMVVVGDLAARPDPISAALTISLPILTLSSLGLVLVAALARGWPMSLTGPAPAMLGLLAFGASWIGWFGSGPAGSLPVDSPWAVVHGGAWLLLAHGVTTFREEDRAGPRWRRIARVLQVAIPAAAAAFVAIVATFDEAFVTPALWPVAIGAIALTGFAVITRQVLTMRDQERSIGRMSHTVRAVEVERRRADAARAAEGQRADMASLILAVSEDVRDPDTTTSYRRALRRIAPHGCRAWIANIDEDRTAFIRVAALGPDAELECTCLAVSMPGDIGDLLHGRAVGRRLDGSPPGEGIIASTNAATVLREGTRSSLSVPIRRSDGWLLGAIHFEDPDGERIHAPAFVALVRSTANQLAGAMDNAALLKRLRTEIAERDRIQAELIQASRAKAVGELAGAVAHEVNNPLTGILGYAELILEDVSATDPRREDLEVIRDEAKRARAIVRALVDLAQNRAGTRAVVALDEVVGAAARATRARASAAGVVLTETCTATPDVTVDRTAFGAVVVALIDNAISAMPIDGEVRLETSAEPDGALVKVIDRGHGMPPDVVRRAFDPFFSTHAARSGRGMGLAIALGVVRDHGGSIWIESRLGEGTTVEVRLPIADPATPIRSTAPTSRQHPDLLPNPRLLDVPAEVVT